LNPQKQGVWLPWRRKTEEPDQVGMIGQVRREKLSADDSAIAKSVLTQLVDEFILDGQTLHAKGSYASCCAAPNENGHFCSSAHIHI